MESEYEDVLCFTEVRWFSRGNVLKRFFELRAEVKAFMQKDGVAVPVLSDPKWLMDLAFLVSCVMESPALSNKPGHFPACKALKTHRATFFFFCRSLLL